MDYTQMSVAELRQAAKELGISGCSSKKKSEIIELITAKNAEEDAKKLASEAKKEAPAPVKNSRNEGAAPAMNKPAGDIPVRAVKNATEETAAPREDRVVRRVVVPEQRSEVRESVRPCEERPAYREERPAYREERPTYREERPAYREERPTYREERPGRDDIYQGRDDRRPQPVSETAKLDSGIQKSGILEIAPEQSFGFIRNENYLPSPDDIYVSPALIKRYNLSNGDILCGNLKIKSPQEKFVALLYITKINGEAPELSVRRKRFDKLTPVFPHERLRLETVGGPTSMRIVDLLSPIGKGQRGMIVSPPKAGKTTLLKDVARAVQKNNPGVHMIILLIDERPEEVTDMKDSIKGDNVEIIYSTFDESPEQHKRVSEMTVEHAKRLVEYGKDVIILLDSITRLARAYNLTCQSSGRTLSGGLDPAALYMPKRFFGAARCMKEGGSLTILATALVDTGSRMDDVVFEEFKGTGNMELTLNRALSERRIFPAIDLPKSSTRREDLLLSPVEQEANLIMRRAFGGARAEEATEAIVNMFTHTRSNAEFITQLKRTRMFG